MASIFLRIVVSCLATAIAAGTASAHDIWLTTTGAAKARRVIINYGHPHDRPPTVADKVLDLVAISHGRQTSLLEGLAPGRAGGAPIVESRPFVDDGHALLAVRYDNGYWVKIADNVYRNVTRRLAPDAADSLWSVKFAKAFTGSGAPFDKVLGHEIELVPLSDPAAVKPGETLRVRVLFRGKPLVNGEVERGDGKTKIAEKDIPKFRTNEDGIATIPIVKTGPHLIVIDHRVKPSLTPELAASDLYNATLWFSVRRAPSEFK